CFTSFRAYAVSCEHVPHSTPILPTVGHSVTVALTAFASLTMGCCGSRQVSLTGATTAQCDARLLVPRTWFLIPLTQPVFCCGLLYSVLVTVSESRYFSGSAATCLIASVSDSALTAQVLVILKYFTFSLHLLSRERPCSCSPQLV